jgi:hypothetical protein
MGYSLDVRYPGVLVDGVLWRPNMWAKHRATQQERRVSAVAANGILQFAQVIKSDGATFYQVPATDCVIAWWHE